MQNGLQKAVFANGCFWCTEAVFSMLKGVVSVKPGYTGGISRPDIDPIKGPTYEQVCEGDTNYAEAIQIEYDPSAISYDDLLAVFFNTHDPTTLNMQGNDVGTQYRSAIFYANDEQKERALWLVKELNDSKAYDKPVVTEVKPLDTFYEAEEYHHQYYKNHEGQPYCQLVIAPKLEKLQKRFEKITLTPEEYHVLREKGTEAPFSGELLHEKRKGTYMCKVCGNPLFPSDAKFDSGTGWPSFDQALPGSTKLVHDSAYGMERTEVVCAKCGSHLGHVFDDGPTATGKRYCMNSVCLELAAEEDKNEEKK